MKNYLSLTKQAVAFRSISTDSAFQKDMRQMADWYESLFCKKGFEVQQVEGYGNPIVQARYEHDPSLPTCLIYGHYDVQPVGSVDEWESDPFTLTEREDRYIARGMADNKGQTMIHIATVFELMTQKDLKYNVLFVLEGDEETGQGDMRQYFIDHTDSLKVDFVLVSDGELSGDHPALEIGFRGVANTTLTIQTANQDVHSGSYGGIMPNAAQELSRLLGSFYDEQYQLQIEGLGEHLPDFSSEQWESLKQSCIKEEDLCQITGAKNMLTQTKPPAITLGLSPTIEITGIESGYTGDGYRNSIPCIAAAKINLRFAPTQDPKKGLQIFQAFVQKRAPKHVEVRFLPEKGGCEWGALLCLENEYAQEAVKTLESIFEKPVLFQCCGGTLPIAHHIDEVLQIPQVHVPLANGDCAMHAANENMTKEAIEKGLAFSKVFFGR